MNIEDLPDESDSSDEDYIPGAKPEDQVSEVESDGDPEDPLSDTEGGSKTNGNKGKKRRKQSNKARKRSRALEEPAEENKQNDNENKQEDTEEERKKRADSLWASFMKDTGFKAKTTKPEATTVDNKPKSETNPTKPAPLVTKPQEKIKVTKVFQFAGEEVTVEKEVPVDSAEARLAQTSSSSDAQKAPGKPRAVKSLGGIGSVLSQLGKKPKISTLEKSKLDWDRFKREENIEEELATHNKGKDGYLERQDFLQRADLRRFEIEKEIRTVERNKRFDNVL